MLGKQMVRDTTKNQCMKTLLSCTRSLRICMNISETHVQIYPHNNSIFSYLIISFSYFIISIITTKNILNIPNNISFNGKPTTQITSIKRNPMRWKRDRREIIGFAKGEKGGRIRKQESGIIKPIWEVVATCKLMNTPRFRMSNVSMVASLTTNTERYHSHYQFVVPSDTITKASFMTLKKAIKFSFVPENP